MCGSVKQLGAGICMSTIPRVCLIGGRSRAGIRNCASVESRAGIGNRAAIDGLRVHVRVEAKRLA